MDREISVVAVIVAYNPDLSGLGRLIDRIIPQVRGVVIVDNSSDDRLANWLLQRSEPGVIHIPLGENRGIAAAQNIGIAWARTQSADQVLLLDHDSLPASDMVDRLATTIREKQGFGEKVGIVGPRFVDKHITEAACLSHFIKLDGCRFRYADFPLEKTAAVPVDFLIASGSLIPMGVFDEVGLMNEALFIDHVDTEFSFRLKMADYISYGVPQALMEHEIGNSSRRIYGRNAPMHSALRHYYIIRNATSIILRPWMKWRWRVALATNNLRRFAFYALFASPRINHITMMLRGVWHGIVGRMGPFRP